MSSSFPIFFFLLVRVSWRQAKEASRHYPRSPFSFHPPFSPYRIHSLPNSRPLFLMRSENRRFLFSLSFFAASFVFLRCPAPRRECEPKASFLLLKGKPHCLFFLLRRVLNPIPSPFSPPLFPRNFSALFLEHPPLHGSFAKRTPGNKRLQSFFSSIYGYLTSL